VKNMEESEDEPRIEMNGGVSSRRPRFPMDRSAKESVSHRGKRW
jgi:hypothetical protein